MWTSTSTVYDSSPPLWSVERIVKEIGTRMLILKGYGIVVVFDDFDDFDDG